MYTENKDFIQCILVVVVFFDELPFAKNHRNLANDALIIWLLGFSTNHLVDEFTLRGLCSLSGIFL